MSWYVLICLEVSDNSLSWFVLICLDFFVSILLVLDVSFDTMPDFMIRRDGLNTYDVEQEADEAPAHNVAEEEGKDDEPPAEEIAEEGKDDEPPAEEGKDDEPPAEEIAEEGKEEDHAVTTAPSGDTDEGEEENEDEANKISSLLSSSSVSIIVTILMY